MQKARGKEIFQVLSLHQNRIHLPYIGLAIGRTVVINVQYWIVLCILILIHWLLIVHLFFKVKIWSTNILPSRLKSHGPQGINCCLIKCFTETYTISLHSRNYIKYFHWSLMRYHVPLQHWKRSRKQLIPRAKRFEVLSLYTIKNDFISFADKMLEF